MLFDFQTEQPVAFWMKNTYIPLDMLFIRGDGRILRIADTSFSPGDDFCVVWHFLDLIPEGADGWQPKYKYAG